MYHHYGVTTLNDLIGSVKGKINNPNYDSSYLKRLEDFLENKIKEEYGNIPVVAISYLIENYNKKGSNQISEKNQLYPKNREFANFFEKLLRSKTKSKMYTLIFVKYINGHPILIVGEPDGLNLEYNKAKIYEVKSFNLTAFINRIKELVEELKKNNLNKKVFYITETCSIQLMLYQYLFYGTQEFSLIGKIDKINLYGTIYFYSENIKNVNWAIETIEQNFNKIKRYIIEHKYNVYNLSLKDKRTININNKKIYYFEIGFRVEYNPKIVENYFKNLDEIIKSLNYADNRNL
jgi:hypothetical protein